jgi:thiamine biosynthesis protein ThiI
MNDTALYLVKVGEILLKLGNRREFENRLRNGIRDRLGDMPHKVEYSPGRFFVGVPSERSGEAEAILARTPGINGFAKTRRADKTVEAVTRAAIEVARTAFEAGKRSFKIESRRSDKSFPLRSYELSSELGARILDALPGTRVDLHHPEFMVNVEIREKAYVYGDPERGLRGLPVGTQGRGLLLLSGGIDSPIAGYLMAKRGLDLDALYFHAWPYTSKEAHDKVKDLARVIAGYTGGLSLWTIPFTEVQLAIKKRAREDLTTLMMRAAMMEIAHRHALRRGDTCIVTGESLGQVASQTAENLRLTEFPTDLPVLRPLIGMDKEETIELAKKIGSFEISIRPYEDCCVIFSPAHPLLRANLEREREAYKALDLGPLLEEALAGVEKLAIPFSERIIPPSELR